MTLFYTGYRPILRGQNTTDWVHPWKGTVGTYSNYSLMSSHHLLEGFPGTDHTPGTGYHPHDVAMTRRFRGYDTEIARVKNVGNGERITGMRYRPWENKATDGAKIFQSTFGHAPRDLYYGLYNNAIFDGVDSAILMDDPGHVKRGVDGSGAAATFGSFAPHEFHGAVSSVAMASGYGQSVATAQTSSYGHDQVNEWHGVTSAKALNI